MAQNLVKVMLQSADKHADHCTVTHESKMNKVSESISVDLTSKKDRLMDS